MESDDILKEPFRRMVFTTTGSYMTNQQDGLADLKKKIINMGGVYDSGVKANTKYIIVFNTANSEKIHHVLFNRHDIILLLPDFVESVHSKWIKGDNIEIEDELRKGLLKPFKGHFVCATNFENEEDRVEIEKLVTENGGQFSRNLHQNITILVTPRIMGVKCEYAVKWNIPLVSPSWVYDSMKSYIPIDPVFYAFNGSTALPGPVRTFDPTMNLIPDDYFSANDDQIIQTKVIQKRKINDVQWKQLMPAPAKRIKKRTGGALWKDEDDEEELREKQKELEQEYKTAYENHLINNIEGHKLTETADDKKGIFFGTCFYLYGFDAKKIERLKSAVIPHGGSVTDDIDNEYITHALIYSQIEYSAIPTHFHAKTFLLKTEWIIETSLEKKSLDNDSFWGNVIRYRNLADFSNLEITISGFKGVELMHIEKLIKMLGATYQPVLKPNSSPSKIEKILISTPGSNKEMYARRWNIPVVGVEWLWYCADYGIKAPLEKWLIPESSQSLKKKSLQKDSNTNNAKDIKNVNNIKNKPAVKEPSAAGFTKEEILQMKKDLLRRSPNPNTLAENNARRKSKSSLSTLSSKSSSPSPSYVTPLPGSRSSKNLESSNGPTKINDKTDYPQIGYQDLQSLRDKQILLNALGAPDDTMNSFTQETKPAEDSMSHDMMLR